MFMKCSCPPSRLMLGSLSLRRNVSPTRRALLTTKPRPTHCQAMEASILAKRTQGEMPMKSTIPRVAVDRPRDAGRQTRPDALGARKTNLENRMISVEGRVPQSGCRRSHCYRGHTSRAATPKGSNQANLPERTQLTEANPSRPNEPKSPERTQPTQANPSRPNEPNAEISPLPIPVGSTRPPCQFWQHDPTGITAAISMSPLMPCCRTHGDPQRLEWLSPNIPD